MPKKQKTIKKKKIKIVGIQLEIKEKFPPQKKIELRTRIVLYVISMSLLNRHKTNYESLQNNKS